MQQLCQTVFLFLELIDSYDFGLVAWERVICFKLILTIFFTISFRQVIVI